jgi:hypothetical protein
MSAMQIRKGTSLLDAKNPEAERLQRFHGERRQAEI